MAMRFRIVVDVEVERDEGKFASRDDLGSQLVEAVESADLGSLVGENDGQYSVTAWEVSVDE